MANRLMVVVGFMVVAMAMTGCASSGDEGLKPDPNAGKSMEQRQQEQIDAIKNNERMPEDAKANAIAAIKGNGHQSATKK